MKNISLLLAILIAFSACKKEQSAVPTPSVNSNSYSSGTIEVQLTSNYIFPYLRISKNGIMLKEINKSGTLAGLSDSSEVVLSTISNGVGDFYIYSNCTKNSLDTTKYMTDNNQIWNRIIVKVKGNIIYDNTSHPAASTKTYAENTYAFKLH